MADNGNGGAIGILFSVEGGASINTGSGKLIRDDLTKIVSAIEAEGGGGVPVKFIANIDPKILELGIQKAKGSAVGAVRDLAKEFKKIESFKSPQEFLDSFTASVKKSQEALKKLNGIARRNRVGVTGSKDKMMSSVTYDTSKNKFLKTENTGDYGRLSKGYSRSAVESGINNAEESLKELGSLITRASKSDIPGMGAAVAKAEEMLVDLFKTIPQDYQGLRIFEPGTDKTINEVVDAEKRQKEAYLETKSAANAMLDVLKRAVEAKKDLIALNRGQGGKYQDLVPIGESDAGLGQLVQNGKSKEAIELYGELTASVNKYNESLKNEYLSEKAREHIVSEVNAAYKSLAPHLKGYYKDTALTKDSIAELRQDMLQSIVDYNNAIQNVYSELESKGLSPNRIAKSKGLLYDLVGDDDDIAKAIDNVNTFASKKNELITNDNIILAGKDITTSVEMTVGGVTKIIEVGASDIQKILDNAAAQAADSMRLFTNFEEWLTGRDSGSNVNGVLSAWFGKTNAQGHASGGALRGAIGQFKRGLSAAQKAGLPIQSGDFRNGLPVRSDVLNGDLGAQSDQIAELLRFGLNAVKDYIGSDSGLKRQAGVHLGMLLAKSAGYRSLGALDSIYGSEGSYWGGSGTVSDAIKPISSIFSIAKGLRAGGTGKLSEGLLNYLNGTSDSIGTAPQEGGAQTPAEEQKELKTEVEGTVKAEEQLADAIGESSEAEKQLGENVNTTVNSEKEKNETQKDDVGAEKAKEQTDEEVDLLGMVNDVTDAQKKKNEESKKDSGAQNNKEETKTEKELKKSKDETSKSEEKKNSKSKKNSEERKKKTKEETDAQKELNKEKKESENLNKESSKSEEKNGKSLDSSTSKYTDRAKVIRDLVSITRELIKEQERSGFITGNIKDGFGLRNIQPGEEITPGYIISKSLLEQREKQLKLAKEEVATRAKADLREKDRAKLVQLEAKSREKMLRDEQSLGRSAETSWAKLKDRMYDLDRLVGDKLAKNSTYAEKYKRMMELAKSGDQRNYDEANSVYRELQDAANRLGLFDNKFFDKLKSTFSTRIRTMLSGAVIGTLMRYVRQIYSNVKELDSALTQMQIVTGKSEKAMSQFADTMAKSAQKVGASISDLVNSATTFARLGYSMEEAGKFAELTAEYSKVANTDVSTATTSITTVIKAFGIQADELEGVLDKLMYIGEHFPVSAEELGTGFQNAGSALKAAGNTIDQSIALLTAANARVQDISRASTGLRTIAARMTRSETELEDLGESIEDVISTPKLQQFMRAFGVEILDARGELRSTYDVLLDLSKVWDDLSTTQRASIAEKLAGTRQQNIFAGLIESMKTEAVGVMDVIGEAGGTLEAANETRLDSIQGRVDQLNASFQELSNTLLNSGLVKDFFGLANGIMQFLNSASGFMGGILVQIPILTAGLITVIGLFQKMNVAGGFNAVVGGIKKLADGMFNLAKYTELANKGIDQSIKGTKKLAEATKAQEEASSKARLGMAGWIAVAVIITSIAIKGVEAYCQSIDEARQKVKDAAKEASEEADAAKKEADEWVSLSNELKKARGNKEALASVYDKLNKKIDVSTELLTGEAEAYNKVAMAVEREVKEAKIRAEIAEKEERAARERAYGENTTSSGIMGVDWLQGDLTGEQIRRMLRAGHSYDAFRTAYTQHMLERAATGPFEHAYDYVSYENLQRYRKENGEDKYKLLVSTIFGFSADDLEKYIKEQTETMQGLFKVAIENSGMEFGKTFLDNAIEQWVRNGADIKDVERNLGRLESSSAALTAETQKYYDMLANPGDYTTSEIDYVYKTIYNLVDNLKAQFPELTKEADIFFATLRSGVEGFKSLSVEAKSILEILNEVQPGFDAITNAMNDMDEAGILSASSLEGLLKIEGDLKDVGFDVNSVIERTAEGYKLADDALEKFIRSNITYYGTIGSKESKEGRENALQNLQKYRAVLLTLLREVEESEQKSGYNRRKDKLKDQLDEYKKLIDLRKKLLETYEDELKYQRELSQRQNALASLQAQLSLAELDQSAAGRARARELRAQVQDAQNDLDDFTLEHAIEVVTNNLDDQYSEYETFINDKLDRLEKAIKGVEDAVNNRIDADTLRELLGLIDEKINNIAPPGMNDYRYIALQNNGVAVKNAAEFDLDLDLRKRYKTWEKYINALYIRMMGNSKVAGLLGIEEHHSGGFVGGVKSNETFAKLMDGEFVVTPNQMGSFVNRTLPSIASGGNTFNSPLISIECDNVSQDALPGLRTIVNDAVEEIKRQFDGGMTRAANYSTNRKKLYI